MTLEKPDLDMAIEWGNIVSVDFNVWLSRRHVGDVSTFLKRT